MKSAASLISLLCLSSAALHAQGVPALMSYQGRVVDSSGTGLGTGTPINRKIIFRLFDAATGGNRLWSEEQTVTLAGGDFSVILGQGVGASYNGSGESPRPSLLTVFGGTDRYLEIVVDNGDGNFTTADTPITPRQRLISTAFAVRAASADSVTSGTDLNLRDSNHGLGYYGTGRPFNGINIDGPVLYGFGGGILGSVSGATQKAALRWDSSGRVSIGAGAAPTQMLDVAGNAKIDGAVMAKGDGGFTFHTVGDADGGLFSPADGVVTLKTNNVERWRVNSSGVLPTLDVTGSIRLSGGGTAPPSTSELGGNGTRMVLFPGTATTVPFAFGTDDNAFWSSAPASASYKWYGGITEMMSLNGLTGTLKLNGAAEPKGIRLPSSFDVAATDFSGTAGNFISFAHSGFSEDYIGYSSNTFFFKDAPGGGDTLQPSINVGGGGTFGQSVGVTGNVTASANVTATGTVAGGSVTSNGKAATVGEEVLRIVRGNVFFPSGALAGFDYTSPVGNGSTLTLQGAAYKFQKISTGRYRITFVTAFADKPSFTFTPEIPAGGGRVFTKITAHETNYVEIEVNNDGDANKDDIAFSFIAVGPR